MLAELASSVIVYPARKVSPNLPVAYNRLEVSFPRIQDIQTNQLEMQRGRPDFDGAKTDVADGSANESNASPCSALVTAL